MPREAKPIDVKVRAAWQALTQTKDPNGAFVDHFASLATHQDSRDLLRELGARVERFSIESEERYRVHNLGKVGGEVLVVHFRPHADEPTTWTCAPPSEKLLKWLPPSHANALSLHNGIAHRFGPFSRLEPIYLSRLTPRDKTSVVPSDDKDTSWKNVSESRAPVIELRSDCYYYHRKTKGPEGGPALACLGHDADGLDKPFREDLTAGDHFIAFTASEIIFFALPKDSRVAWFPD